MRKVGILGGGQLARMLAESAFRLGLVPVVLTEGAEDPAAQLCPRRILGSLSDPDTLDRFLSETELVVFENEFVDTEHLRQYAGPKREGHFFPSLSTIARFRDKLTQKQMLNDLGIPTSRFVVYPGADLGDWLNQVRKDLGERYVLKWGRMGYDGKGVFFLTHLERQRDQARTFGQWAVDRGISLFAEAHVTFRRELAMIGCRSRTGELVTYPLVISEQENGVCLDVTGPATAFGVPEDRGKQAEEYVRRVAEAGQMIGCFAIEFFEMPDGALWVNEMAPRVHNSGHYTQLASVTSQFENHWRAVLGLPLGSVESWPAFFMGNLLGPAGISRSETDFPLPVVSRRLSLHWYGKRAIHPGRKLGHVNGVASRTSDIPALREEVRRCREQWATALKSQLQNKTVARPR